MGAEMKDQWCANCFYFRDFGNKFCCRFPPAYIPEGEDENGNFSNSVYYDAASWVQPSVTTRGWCGEWKNKDWSIT
jgi:hypothetical protein